MTFLLIIALLTNLKLINRSLDCDEIQFAIQRVEVKGDTLTVEGAGIDKNGNPAFGMLLDLSRGSQISASFIPSDSIFIEGKYFENENIFEVEVPMYFRELVVAPAVLRPYRTIDGGTIVYTRGILKLNYSGPPMRNYNSYITGDFLPLYRSAVVNFTLPERKPVRGGMIVVYADTFETVIDSFVQWKKQLGYRIIKIPLSSIGQYPTAQEIKNFIADIYFSTEPRPSYLVLIGDANIPGGIPTHFYEGDASDFTYGTLYGNDYLPEILVARIPVRTLYEAQIALYKSIYYEREPDTTKNWFKRALLVAGVYMHGGDIVNSTKLTKLWARMRLLEGGFTQVDTVFYYNPPGTGGTADDITEAINNGVSIVNYRGWSNTSGWTYPQYYLDHLGGLNNGRMLPVFFSLSCGTGNFVCTNDPCFGEALIRLGIPSTPVQPKGAVAFMGPTEPITHTRWNNAIDVGVIEALVQDSIYHFADICTRGLLELFVGFPDRGAPGDSIEFNFRVYALLGDPSLMVYTDKPIVPTLEYPAQLYQGHQGVAVRVKKNGEPVKDAYVNFYSPDGILKGAYTDEDGFAYLVLDISNVDSVLLTVSGRNLYPVQIPIEVVSPSTYLTVADTSLSEATGNGNGILNPGETYILNVAIYNNGTSASLSGHAVLHPLDTLTTVLDSLFYFGSLNPNDTVWGSFTFRINPWTRNNSKVRFKVDIISNADTSIYPLSFTVKAPEFKIVSLVINDGGNGVLEPGEQASISIKVANRGDSEGGPYDATLTSLFTGLDVLDSISSTPQIGVGDTMTISDFTLYAHPDAAYGRKIALLLNLKSSELEERVIKVYLRLGVTSNSIPGGPDSYGYWVYDSYDTSFAEHPSYEWVELSGEPPLGDTILSNLDDAITHLDLPFTFKFYGNEFNRITVSTNGWISFGETDLFSARNWPIPSPFGPPNLVAAFWDDIKLTNTAVYYYYDTINHRFIIEWKDAINKYDNSSLETFEIILLDPAHYPTRTEDGEIIFQYESISNVDSAHYFSTVGIENENHAIGLQYVYGQYYDSTSTPLGDGLAIKFTTDPPDTHTLSIGEGAHPSYGEVLSVRPTIAKSSLDIDLMHTERKYCKISIYSVNGSRVKTLFEGEVSGQKRITWDLKDERGRRVKNGVYFILLEAGNQIERKKVVIVR